MRGHEATGRQTPVQGSRTFLVIHYVSYVGISAHAAFIGLFAWFGVPVMAWFNVASVAIWIAGRLANKRLYPRLAAALLTAEVVTHAVLAVSILGWNSGFSYYLVPLIPFVIFNDQLPTRTVIAGSVLITGVYLTLRATCSHIVPPATWDARADFVQYMNILVPLTALVIISIYFRFASIDVERAMEALAMTDALTKLPNRRRMRELLDVERVRFSRNKRPFAIVIADVDDFKLINDRRGHDCGDHVLVEVSTALRSVLRGQDTVARWGGEEFLFLLPDTDLRGAGIVAEKLRSTVESSKITFGNDNLHITMTFGVAAYFGGSSIDECVRRADEALYGGKHRGKNQVALEESDSTARAESA